MQRKLSHATYVRSTGLVAISLLGLLVGCVSMPETNEPKLWAQQAGSTGQYVGDKDRKAKVSYLVATRLSLAGQSDLAEPYWQKHIERASQGAGDPAVIRTLAIAERKLWVALGHGLRGDRALAAEWFSQADEDVQDLFERLQQPQAEGDLGLGLGLDRLRLTKFYGLQVAMAAIAGAEDVFDQACERHKSFGPHRQELS